MKIIILSYARTRSTFLLETLCAHYKLENLFEPYDYLANNHYRQSLSKSPQDLWIGYKNKVKNLTESYKNKNNFALKIFTHGFFNSFKFETCIFKNKEWSLDNTDFLDLEKDLQISQYDKLYFLYRNNINESIISYLFGIQNEMLYGNDRRKVAEKNNKCQYLHYKYGVLKALVTKYLLMQYFENQLKNTQLPYVKLEYNEVPTYINQHYPNTIVDVLEPKYNYKSIVKNYDNIVMDIEKAKVELQDPLKNLFSQ